jgi:tetratricopeptide (TPR) repeat protein
MSVGIAWFFLFLLPTANIVPIGELIAERFLYLPSAGFCLALGALALWTSEQPVALRLSPARLRAASFAAFALVLIPFAILTAARNAEWHDPEVLWRSTLARSPQAPHARENLAAILLARGEFAEAEEIIESELARFPEKPMLALLAGQLYAGQGDAKRAQEMFERAIALGKPGDIEFDDFQRGSVLLRLSRFGEALDALEHARDANPADPALLNNIGVALAQVGRREEALQVFAEAIRLFAAQGFLSEEDQKNFEGAKENQRMLERSL